MIAIPIEALTRRSRSSTRCEMKVSSPGACSVIKKKEELDLLALPGRNLRTRAAPDITWRLVPWRFLYQAGTLEVRTSFLRRKSLALRSMSATVGAIVLPASWDARPSHIASTSSTWLVTDDSKSLVADSTSLLNDCA